MPLPNYGYVRSSVILRGRIGDILYNDWVDGNIDELTYVYRRGGNQIAWSCIFQQTTDKRRARRYHVRYTRGVEVKGDMWDRIEELQIDKVAVQKDIIAKTVRR